jgi:pre-mRNA-splicing factor RBM22/SLT11
MIPTQEANKNFYIDQANRSIDSLALPYDALESNPILAELARNRAKPYYKRNLPQICSFFAKGGCNRGDECPYRHELPDEKFDPELANQNIVDRFHGKNDPVANKILNKAYDSDKVKAPADQSLATLFLNDLPTTLTQGDLIDIFKTYGEVDEVTIFPSGRQALVSFIQRSHCEKAISELYGKLVMKGQSVQVRWARPEKERKVEKAPRDPSLFVPQNIPSMIKAPLQSNPNIRPPTMPPPDLNMGQINTNKFIENIAQIGNPTYYPSMDPNAMGGMRQNRPGYNHKQ